MKTPVDPLEAWENEGGALASGSQKLNRSRAEAARLREIFSTVQLREISGVDGRSLSHEEIVQLLPPYGGEHPVKAILIDRQTGKAYGIASGWEAGTSNHHGVDFRSGAITSDMAAQAGPTWRALGNHVEPVGAAFMRKMGMTDGTLYINGRNPCWGTPDGTGCYYNMTEFLAEDSQLTVYNKYGSDSLKSRPDRLFRFRGLPD
jgi:hypothetical protein